MSENVTMTHQAGGWRTFGSSNATAAFYGTSPVVKGLPPHFRRRRMTTVRGDNSFSQNTERRSEEFVKHSKTKQQTFDLNKTGLALLACDSTSSHTVSS